MNHSNTCNVIINADTFQEEISELFQTVKLGYPSDILTNSTTGGFSSISLQNQLLKGQINELQKLILQYEFTNKQALETLRENIILRDNVMTLELKVGLLSQTTDLQTLEIKKRDHTISSLKKDVAEHNKRIELISEKYEEEGFPACNICCRNPPVVTICKNHSKEDQIVGCIFCALRKCPICRNKEVERSFVQNESKKIKKIQKIDAIKTKEDDKQSIKLVKGNRKSIKKLKEVK